MQQLLGQVGAAGGGQGEHACPEVVHRPHRLVQRGAVVRDDPRQVRVPGQFGRVRQPGPGGGVLAGAAARQQGGGAVVEQHGRLVAQAGGAGVPGGRHQLGQPAQGRDDPLVDNRGTALGLAGGEWFDRGGQRGAGRRVPGCGDPFQLLVDDLRGRGPAPGRVRQPAVLLGGRGGQTDQRGDQGGRHPLAQQVHSGLGEPRVGQCGDAVPDVRPGAGARQHGPPQPARPRPLPLQLVQVVVGQLAGQFPVQRAAVRQHCRVVLAVQLRRARAGGVRGVPPPEQLVDQASPRVAEQPVERGPHVVQPDREAVAEVDGAAGPQHGQHPVPVLPHGVRTGVGGQAGDPERVVAIQPGTGDLGQSGADHLVHRRLVHRRLTHRDLAHRGLIHRGTPRLGHRTRLAHRHPTVIAALVPAVWATPEPKPATIQRVPAGVSLSSDLCRPNAVPVRPVRPGPGSARGGCGRGAPAGTPRPARRAGPAGPR